MYLGIISLSDSLDWGLEEINGEVRNEILPSCTFINFTEGPEQKGWLMVITPCILNTPAGYCRRRPTCTIYNAPTAGKLITSNQDIVKTFSSIAAAYVKLTPPINLNKESVNSFKVNFPSLISRTSRPQSAPKHKMWRQKERMDFPSLLLLRQWQRDSYLY